MAVVRSLKFFVRVAWALVLVAGAASTAHAQVFISPLIGYDFGGDAGCPEISNCEDKNSNVGVSIGGGGFIAFEEELAYARNFFGETPGTSSSVLTLMSNIMVAPRIGPVRPYVLVGAGLIKSHVEASLGSLVTSDNNSFGWNTGGGLMLMFGHVGVRGDVRYFHGFQDMEVLGLPLNGVKLDFGRIAAGVVFQF